MSRKTAQARKKAALLAQRSARTETVVPTKPSVHSETVVHVRPKVPKEYGRKMETPKVRGWVLTTWLVSVLVGNTLFTCLSGVELIAGIVLHQPASWLFIVSMIFCTMAVISAIGVLRWRKWGYYLFMFTAWSAFITDIVLSLFTVVPTSMYTTHVSIVWPAAAILLWRLEHSKKRRPMFN